MWERSAYVCRSFYLSVLLYNLFQILQILLKPPSFCEITEQRAINPRSIGVVV